MFFNQVKIYIDFFKIKMLEIKSMHFSFFQHCIKYSFESGALEKEREKSLIKFESSHLILDHLSCVFCQNKLDNVTFIVSVIIIFLSNKRSFYLRI